MSAHTDLLAVAQRQMTYVREGQLEAAVALMADRQVLLAGAPNPNEADLDALREVVRLDSDLASAIRGRMTALQHEAATLRRGRTALAGYQPTAAPRQWHRLDSVG